MTTTSEEQGMTSIFASDPIPTDPVPIPDPIPQPPPSPQPDPQPEPGYPPILDPLPHR